MKRIVFALLVTIGLHGCATTLVSEKDARQTPRDRIFLNEQLPRNGNALTVFVRDVGFSGSGVYQHLFIDGKKAASLDPGEKVEFVLTPGEHIFGVIPTDAFGTHALNSIDQDLKPNRAYYYRIQTDGNSFRTSIQRYLPDAK